MKKNQNFNTGNDMFIRFPFRILRHKPNNKYIILLWELAVKIKYIIYEYSVIFSRSFAVRFNE